MPNDVSSPARQACGCLLIINLYCIHYVELQIINGWKRIIILVLTDKFKVGLKGTHVPILVETLVFRVCVRQFEELNLSIRRNSKNKSIVTLKCIPLSFRLSKKINSN